MSEKYRNNIRRSRRGNMPFAMIAVTLLILAGMYGIVVSGIERTQDNMRNMQDEMNSVGDAVNAAKGTMERGIGDIILSMGRDASTGSLEERYGTFDSRLEEWISFQFPMRASGAVITVTEHDIELGVGTLRVASDDVYGMDGVRPSCFRADGNVIMTITTSSGSTVKEVSITADGMSALPLLLESASLFEASITGPWSLVTELMSYQLTSLAQYRVMQGYGSASEYGEKGTNAIITKEDVDLAYRIALSVAETTYLRTGDLVNHDSVDVAELIAFRDGFIEMDLGAVLAQTLAGIADDLVISWLDYFLLIKVLNIIDAVVDTFKNVFNWLWKAATGSEAETAGGYLSATMSNYGIPESAYRYLLNGQKGTIDVPSVSRGDGDGMITVPAFTVTFGYPNVDVLNWKGWDGFMKRYRAEHNQIMDALIGTVNYIAAGLAGSYGLGVMKIKCDPHDGTDFITSVTDAVAAALDAQKENIEDSMERTVRSGRVIDTLYVTIYEQMVSGRDGLFGVTALKDTVRSSVRSHVSDHVKKEYGTPIDPSVTDSIVDEIMASDAVLNTINGYESLVGERMSLFEGVLNSIEKNTNSMFKDVIVVLIRYGLDSLSLFPLLKAKMVMLVHEMAEYISLDPLAGVYGLPGTDSFVLNGGDGTIVREFVSTECDVDLKIDITPPSKSRENVHYVGFREDREASYSSMFRIYVTADVRYRAESASSLMRILGSYDSAVTGTSHSEFDIAIAVMSGWALAGVTYTPSRTIIDDVVMVFMKLIEPLIEPLLELIRMAKSILHIMTNAMMRVAQYVSDLMMKLYDVIMGPLEKFGELVNDILGKIFDGIITTIVLTLGSQTFGVNLMGMRLEIVTDLAGEFMKGASTTKIKLTLPIFGVKLSASLDIKKDKSSKFSFTGNISAEAESWNLHVVIDPLMKVRKHLVEINGTFRGTDMHAVMPQAVQYDELEFRLSDIPGLGSILQNIPLPIPGVKGDIDAGFELKYNLPYVYGVVINEFEQNPSGEDRDNEWAELYNSTTSAVNLEGYMLMASSGTNKVYEIHDTVLGPGERTVVTFPGLFLNNTKESLVLYDPDGRVADATPIKADSKNDDFTWQRETDASAKWVFKKGTKGEDNGSRFVSGNPIRAAIAQCVMDAATKAFGEMGLKIVGPDGIALFLKRVIELTVENAINMIASCVVSASIFIEIAVRDVTGSAGSGIRFSLMLDKDIIKDGLTWAVGQITAMMNNIDNPTGMTPKQIISDDIYFQTMIFAQVTTPKILGSLGGHSGITAGVVVSCNITALCNLIGKPGGTWRVNIGLVLEDIQTKMVPPMIKTDPDKKTDLWLFRMTLERAKQ